MIYGIDIGGTKIETAIFNADFEKQQCWRVATPTGDYEQFLCTIVEQVTKADNLCDVQGKVGIGMPGLIDHNEQSLSANVPCATGKNVRQDLQLLLNRDIAIENDCRCFALSEAHQGAGEGYSRVYGAIIGTGAAGGLCIDGKLDTGRNGIIGEYGHIPIPAFLQKKYDLSLNDCACGFSGCMEYYIAGPGISRLFQLFYQREVSALQFSENLANGDADSLAVFNCYTDLLGYTFSTIIHNHDPDIIVLGGGVSKIAHVVAALPTAVIPYLFKSVVVPAFVVAKFGDASGGRGAAFLSHSQN
ncbi:ROK family protein [Pseudoalteromonas sp. K222D]|uniref:ROK family protein n=1 Tax=Pseudoalteromonas TaxID=53246 RepID=UPI001AD61C5F|nr:ROK family protein [Pseudoalteromonas sp. K222D]MBO7926864.1 ROK family protein [Pseudoalteromonas sp. K222D]